VIRDAFPVVSNHLPEFAQAHPTIHNLTQQALPAAHADGDEIGAGRGIIMARQAYGTAVMLLIVVWHLVASVGVRAAQGSVLYLPRSFDRPPHPDPPLLPRLLCHLRVLGLHRHPPQEIERGQDAEACLHTSWHCQLFLGAIEGITEPSTSSRIGVER